MTRKAIADGIAWTVYALTIGVFIWLLVLLFAGCAVFSSQQVETALDGTKRETRIKVYTMFDANSDLTKLRASTTDKTQGMTLAGLSESSSSTNFVHILQLLATIAAAAK
jgi:hypothetical protein